MMPQTNFRVFIFLTTLIGSAFAGTSSTAQPLDTRGCTTQNLNVADVNYVEHVTHQAMSVEQAVLSQLQSRNVPSHQITVSHYQGEVTLSGYVASNDEADVAGAIALSIPGVYKVNNLLTSMDSYATR